VSGDITNGAPGGYPREGGVTLGAALREQLVAACRNELPNEACGIIAGRDRSVLGIHPLTNAAASRERYELDPLEQLEAYHRIDDAGHQALGVYHSHPETPARPSATDIAEAYDPGVLYFIVSFAADQPSVRAFSIRNGQVTEADVTTNPPATQAGGPDEGTVEWQ